MFSCKTWKKPETESDGESSEEYEEEIRDSDEILFCDVCERDFYSQQSYEKHVSEHKTCSIDGCEYTAHEKMIEKHIKMQHISGLYEKIRNVSTPEDIAKWIEERKLKYPTKENVQKRYERQEAMLKRGEKIGERKNRFGKDRTRLARIQQRKPLKKKMLKITHKTCEKPKESLIDEKCDWNGTMFPFKGTKELYENETLKEMSDYDDDEWSVDTSNTKVTVKLNNALGALMGAYMSDDDQELSPGQSAQQDDETPTEVKIQRQQIEYPNEEPKDVKVRRIKKRKLFRGKNQRKLETDNAENGFSRLKFFKRRITLLEKLLDSEIRHERNVLLQCVQYVVSNNFFRND